MFFWVDPNFDISQAKKKKKKPGRWSFSSKNTFVGVASKVVGVVLLTIQISFRVNDEKTVFNQNEFKIHFPENLCHFSAGLCSNFIFLYRHCFLITIQINLLNLK